MVDLSITDSLAIGNLVCITCIVVGILTAVIYISLFLTIAYPIGVLSRFVYHGDFVLFDETLMNTLFWGSTGITRASHLTYIVSSVILVVLFKHYLYEPHTEKQG